MHAPNKLQQLQMQVSPDTWEIFWCTWYINTTIRTKVYTTIY